jgi:hypothetical protein
MAADLYPQGMTLHSIGYAALKYPELPPGLPIPLGNQLGVLQRVSYLGFHLSPIHLCFGES